jgi:hypothetical protein
MKKAHEYREHAEECRKLAQRMRTDEGRDELLKIAAHWDELAEGREDLIRNHPELSQPGEQEEVDRRANG